MGGGVVVKNNFLRKNFFGTKGTNNLQVFNHLNLAALHYGHPLTTWFVGKFYTHTPLFKPPRYGPGYCIVYTQLPGTQKLQNERPVAPRALSQEKLIWRRTFAKKTRGDGSLPRRAKWEGQGSYSLF
jgi:hypothetical protein